MAKRENQEARRHAILLPALSFDFEHFSVIESQQEDVAEIITTDSHTGNAVSGENIQQLPNCCLEESNFSSPPAATLPSVAIDVSLIFPRLILRFN